MIVPELRPGDTFKDKYGNQVEVKEVRLKNEFVECSLRVLSGPTKGGYDVLFTQDRKGINLGAKTGDFIAAKRRSLS